MSNLAIQYPSDISSQGSPKLPDKIQPPIKVRDYFGITDDMVKPYLNFADKLAEIYARNFPFVDIRDLRSEARIGLLNALRDYKKIPDKTFEAYAAKRIKGAILDYLRKMAITPLHIKSRQKLITEATDSLEKKLGRVPNIEEVANFMGTSLKRLRYLLIRASYTVESIDAFIEDKERDGYTYPTHPGIEDKAETGRALDGLINQEMMSSLRVAIETLNPQERLVIRLYYFVDMTMPDISHVVGRSRGWASHVHSTAISKLRQQFQNNGLL